MKRERERLLLCQHSSMGIQGCSPPRHPRFCTHGPAMNTNHITNTYMHKIVVKTPCRIVETIQLLEALPPRLRLWGLCPPSRLPNALPLNSTGDLYPQRPPDFAFQPLKIYNVDRRTWNPTMQCTQLSFNKRCGRNGIRWLTNE